MEKAQNKTKYHKRWNKRKVKNWEFLSIVNNAHYMYHYMFFSPPDNFY